MKMKKRARDDECSGNYEGKDVKVSRLPCSRSSSSLKLCNNGHKKRRGRIPNSAKLKNNNGGEEKHGQRHAANARERSRMRVLSKAFSKLKTSLPWVPADTKLSKLDTLRLAASYIGHLADLLTEDNNSCKEYNNSRNTIHPLNLTWPFAINSRVNTGDDIQEDDRISILSQDTLYGMN